MTQPIPGWYPDPSDSSRRRYFDGEVWTEHYASYGAPAPYPAPPANLPAKTQWNWKWIAGIGAVFLVLILIAGLGDSGDKDKPAKRAGAESSETIAAPSAPKPTAAPGSVAPEGVRFQTQQGPLGEVVVADFDIGDAMFMYLTRFGARSKTKDILLWVKNKYPQASSVEVQGRFPTKDAYGNSQNSIVLDVFYTRATLDKINFEGIDNDKIWAVRDGGTIHPELQ